MHVSAKKAAICGLMLAFTVVCIALGSVIETNTLFLLAAASYFVGIVIREMGIRMGAAFWIAGSLLGFLMSPNKLYVLTYSAMGCYILAAEFAAGRVGKYGQSARYRFWAAKYVIFNLIYIPVVIGFQKIFFMKTMSAAGVTAVIAAGQVLLFIYDKAYEYVQKNIWSKVRERLL